MKNNKHLILTILSFVTMLIPLAITALIISAPHVDCSILTISIIATISMCTIFYVLLVTQIEFWIEKEKCK